MPIQPGTVIQELLDKYRSRQENISFFVGAGLSMPLFPSWKDLLRELLNLCGEKRNLGFDHNDLDARISNGDNSLELANYFRKALPDASYYDLLDRLFDKEFGKDDIPKAYEALLNLSPQLLVTTNYDNIPNACLGNTHTIVTHDQISELNRRLQKGKPCVLKLHGDIDNQKTMILTSEDYSNIIHKNLETNAFMKSYFTNYTVLFLGFSLTDPHILLYLDFLKGIQITAGITHYALLPNVTPFDCHILEDRYNVKVIPYKPADPSHPEVWELIRCFQAVADGKEPEALTAG
ncbi:MAG: SIR2 family protein [Acidobacteriota bacterium]|nr:SIR2 family protein [Acidobacteriota bacterium]